MELQRKHSVLLGTHPTATQIQLYQQFPTMRGFSSRLRSTEHAEAALVTALLAGNAQTRVMLLCPPVLEKWLLEQFDGLADRIFARCRSLPADRVEFVVKGYVTLFKKITLASRVLQLPQEPEHWVSFGFSHEDLVPEWLSQKLLIEDAVV